MAEEVEGLGPGGLNIAHLNVASILGAKKFEMLRLQIEGSLFHVFCASETWLTREIPNDLISIKGYNVARLDRGWSENRAGNSPKKGGGLACYVREGTNMNDCRYANLNCTCKDLEMQWISIENKNMRRIVIINTYRPPQGDYKKACTLIHESIKEANLKDNAEIFLVGDFNINWKDKQAPATKELGNTVAVWGLKPQIKGVTRIGLVNGVIKNSCIDNILTNSEEIIKAQVIEWNFSDHLVVAVKRKRVRVRCKKVSFKGRSYKNYVREDMQQELIEQDWGKFYETQAPLECWGIMENRIREHLNRVAPQKEFRVKEVREPWVTNEILEEIKDKDRVLREARQSGLAGDFVRARMERNRVGRLIEQAKADFLKDQQEELVDDPKKFWRLVKSILPGKGKSRRKITLADRKEGKDMEVEDTDTANYINKFFSGIGPKLAKVHNEPWVFYGEKVENECPAFVTDYEQVSKLCGEILTVKSSGFEDIATKVFKDAFRVLVPQLVYIFNLSFSTGMFPDSWKQATIIPLYKGGDKLEVSNYRPVSLLPLPGKVIEKIAHAKMSSFLERYELLSDRQGGFRKGHSTMASIAELTDSILCNINKGLTSLAAFIDLRKAFDTVDHNILLRKLRCYGIEGTNLRWCTNYLSGRTQRTLANAVLSINEVITCGVPQGSVLGPLFFILYVNDVQKAVTGVNLQLYADDTVIYVAGEDSHSAAAKLQPALNKFSKWCAANKLTLNVSKTKLMTFGTRNMVKKAKDTVVKIGGTPLQIVPTYKYLGVTLDATLTFDKQVKSTISMVAFKTNLLARIRKYVKESVAIKIYKSMILPYFDYGDVIYNSACKDGLDKLQRLQNRCLKICKHVHVRYSTKELHAETKMPMLDVRRTAHINNFMFKRLEKLDLVDDRNIRTRAHDAPLFKVKVPKCEAYKRSVEYAGSLQWNNLPSRMRNIDSYDSFKAKQKAMSFPAQ